MTSWKIEGLEDVRERHGHVSSKNLDEQERKKIYWMDGIYKGCSFKCTYEKINYRGKDTIYVICRFGSGTIADDFAANNAPIIIISEGAESYQHKEEEYGHSKYHITELRRCYSKPTYSIIKRIEFFSDLDAETVERLPKEQNVEHLKEEVCDAIDLYDAITRSFGKRITIRKSC